MVYLVGARKTRMSDMELYNTWWKVRREHLSVVIQSYPPRAAFLPDGRTKLLEILRLRKRSETNQELIILYIAYFGTFILHNKPGCRKYCTHFMDKEAEYQRN